MQRFSNLHPFYSPEDNNSGGGTTLTVDDIFDDLKSDGEEDKAEDLLADDKSDDKKDDSKKEDKKASDEKDENEEVELDEDEEPDDDKLELVTPARKKDILKKYPEIFKDFPYLETAYYREQKFTEIFPTVEDAKEASDKIQQFDQLESEIFKTASTEAILTAVKQSDPKTFAKMVDNYLPALEKVDQPAYFHIIANTGKRIIAAMVNDAKQTNNEDLGKAAVLLHQFLGLGNNFTPPANYSKEQPNPDADKVRQERQQLFQERFETVASDLDTRTTNAIRGTIATNIDPKGLMTDYVKKVAIKSAMDDVEEQISQDSRFRTRLNRLWEDAAKKNFSRDSLKAIESTYKGKAKELLLPAIKKARNDALRGLGKRVQDDSGERKSRITPGKSSSSSGSSSSKNDPKSIPRGMTSLDFLMQD